MAGVFVVPSVLTVGAIAGMRIGSHVPHLPHGGSGGTGGGGDDVVVMVRVAQMFGHAGSTAKSCPLLCSDMIMPPRLRKFALTAHVTASVGWLGAVAAFLALAIAGLTSGDTQMVRAAYLAMGLTGWFVIVPLSLASLLTGLVQALGTTWGLFRHYWVLAKLLITVVATILLLVHMQPVGHLARVVAVTTLVSGQLAGMRVQLVADAAAALVALLMATGLSVYKPRGLTAYGLRMQPESAAGPTRELAAPTPRWVVAGIIALVLLFVFRHLTGMQGGHS